MADCEVLDFHNCLLRESDVKLLEYPNWLNDNLISFAYEYFEYEMFSVHADKVTFVDPSIVQFLRLGSKEDAFVTMESMKLSEKEIIFFAINDSTKYDDSGSHWSVLIYRKSTRIFEHFDSMSCSYSDTSIPSPAAKDMAVLAEKFLCPSSPTPNIKQQACPQQSNCCDCGMYLIVFTQLLADSLLNGNTLDFDQVTPHQVKEARMEWRDKIYELRNVHQAEGLNC